MAQHNRIGVAYFLTGDDLDPAEITLRTGVTPTRAWKRGALIPRANPQPMRGAPPRPMTYKFGVWEVASDSGGTQPIDPVDEMDRRIAEVLAKLKPRWSVFVDLGLQYEVGLSCVAQVVEVPDPALTIQREAVKQLAELNASFSIDLYCWTEAALAAE